MPTITFQSPFEVNSKLIFSPQEIRNSYLYNIPMSGTLQNAVNKFSDDDIIMFIRAAQKEIENYLSIKLFRQLYVENLSFSRSDWMQWGFIKTTWQVVCPLKLQGFLGTILQSTYPKEWLSIKKESDDQIHHRQIYLIPTGSTGAATLQLIYAGLIPNMSFLSYASIPNFWTISYVTGFDVIPADIIQYVGMLAAINLLDIASSSILGIAGIGSQSLSIDGLSQSLSNKGFEERIKNYGERLEKKLRDARDNYRGFMFGVV